eukprot:scaffold34268_cov43-Cyclotella_meneghiniana.AAC.2
MQLRLPWARGPTNNPDRDNTETEEYQNEILQEIETFGDQITTKLDGQVRIGFQNINGITKANELIGAEELEAMNEMNFDMIGMIETNVNWTHNARNYLHSAASLRFNNTARCVMSSGRASLNDIYLPGGTAMITQGNFSWRVIARGMDHLGSFTWMAIRGKKDIGVIVITAYRVCQRAGTIKSGPDTAFTRQCIQMREEGDKNPDPRNKIFENMNDILEEWMGKGFHPLVMIDSNSEITERNLNEFNKRNGLHDIITSGRDTEAPPSYARGRKRIDFLLGNDHVQRAVINSGALGLYDGLKASDHTMQYVDLDE